METDHKVSKHYNNERYKREKLINRRLHGDGNVIDKFVIDRGHKNGNELHCITDNGIILIYNYKSGLFITKLIARPKQIKRYYQDVDRRPPKWLLNLCYRNQTLGYNK